MESVLGCVLEEAWFLILAENIFKLNVAGVAAARGSYVENPARVCYMSVTEKGVGAFFKVRCNHSTH